MQTILYNKEQEYDEKIAPLIKNLMLECQKIGVPMFFSAAVANEGGKTKYRSEMISPLVFNTELYDDKLTSELLILNGFVPSKGDIPIEDEEMAEELKKDDGVDIEEVDCGD